MSYMDDMHLNKLCGLLEDELERQQNALDIRRALSRAVKTRDIASVQSMTNSLMLLIQESADAEKERLGLMARMVKYNADNKTLPNLSQIVAAAPEPWRTRLEDFQHRLDHVFGQAMIAAKENEALLSRAIGIVSDALAAWNRGPDREGDSSYNARGRECGAPMVGPMLIDSRG